MKTKNRTEHGQSALEFALILPVMILVVMGIADFGIAFFNTISIASAAREGARVGIIRQCSDSSAADTDSIQYRVVQSAQGVGLTGAGVSISYPDGSTAVGNRIQVTVNKTYSPMTPVIGSMTVALLGGSITLSQSAQMTIEAVNSSC